MPRTSTSTGAEKLIEDRQFQAAERTAPAARLFDGSREAAVRKLADLEREGGLVRRTPATAYDAGRR